MSLQYQYNDFRNNLHLVAREDASECPCGGYGWLTSPFDTHHKCPRHFEGQRHPESDEYATARAVEVKVVEEGELVNRYQVEITLHHCAHEDAEPVFLHDHEFDTEEEAQEFGDWMALRADIGSRVQNQDHWIHLNRPPTPEDIADQELRGEL